MKRDIETQQLIIEIFEALKGQEWTAKDTIQLFQLLMREAMKTQNEILEIVQEKGWSEENNIILTRMLVNKGTETAIWMQYLESAC